MNYKEFTSTFEDQLEQLPYAKQLELALAVCNKLYPDYQKFAEIHQWGNAGLLWQAIRLCEQSKTGVINEADIEEMLEELEPIIPDTDDFGDTIGSCGLNASAAVYSTLEFLLDKDSSHIYDIGILYIDTVDFKLKEYETLSDDETDEHPAMLEALSYILELSS